MDPVLPDLEGDCVTRVVPAAMAVAPRPYLLPEAARDADAVVLLVLDGLGWRQLQDRPEVAPTLSSMQGGPITTVMPTTTVTALTSIACGVAPAVHGLVGYRLRVRTAGGDDVLNVLRWTTSDGDARETIPPESFQTVAPFGGRPVPFLSRGEFAGTGFTVASFHGSRLVGWRVPSTMVLDAAACVSEGEPFVYAYYDGIDRVAHERGVASAHYDAELRAADRLVGDLLDLLPPSVALVVTADHGQVDVAERTIPIAGDLMEPTTLLSGEGRFRWLHLRPDVDPLEVAAAARDRYGDVAWVTTREEAVAAGWFGGPMSAATADRLGDVALLPFEPVAFVDPADVGPLRLVSRHGSLTADEVLVPLVAARGRRQ